MTGKHQIVVSAENNAYTAWQCKLFYYSCVTRLKHQPLILVHELGGELHPSFHELAKAGCAVHLAPGYRFHGSGDDYACRNTAGSLIHAGKILPGRDTLIVLCDSDMIFTGPVRFPEVLSGEFSSFVNYDRDFVSEALGRLGIQRAALDREKEGLRCCVPHVVPTVLSQELGATWLEAIDAFMPRRWEDLMYAFGLSVVKLGLKLQITHLVDHNYWPDHKVKAPIIHYAYGDERWTKRNYFRDDQMHDIWNPTATGAAGSILAEILKQISEAREFYGEAYFSASPA
ncbi:MAG: hypothetical protein QOD75_3867 [Blastocatellia bacterium]|jgi:hypothetical protein|nr:hypothetical protein [Blastocatellia bacterium]